MKIKEEKLIKVAQLRGISDDDLFDILFLDKRYIHWDLTVKTETKDAFFAEYPEFAPRHKRNAD